MTKTPETSSSEALQACDACGAQALRPRSQLQRFPYGKAGEQVELVAEVTVWECGECSFAFTGSEAEEARHEAVCRHLGVLTPQEVRQLRARYQLSQAQLAELTGFGEASIKRWELGLNIQNLSADRLLRLLEDPWGYRRLLQLSSASRQAAKAHLPRFRTSLPQSAYRDAAAFEL